MMFPSITNLLTKTLTKPQALQSIAKVAERAPSRTAATEVSDTSTAITKRQAQDSVRSMTNPSRQRMIDSQAAETGEDKGAAEVAAEAGEKPMSTVDKVVSYGSIAAGAALGLFSVGTMIAGAAQSKKDT